MDDLTQYLLMFEPQELGEAGGGGKGGEAGWSCAELVDDTGEAGGGFVKLAELARGEADAHVNTQCRNARICFIMPPKSFEMALWYQILASR